MCKLKKKKPFPNVKEGKVKEKVEKLEIKNGLNYDRILQPSIPKCASLFAVVIRMCALCEVCCCNLISKKL